MGEKKKKKNRDGSLMKLGILGFLMGRFTDVFIDG
jgi:F420-0:gamma-glutamyl ligase-like protein